MSLALRYRLARAAPGFSCRSPINALPYAVCAAFNSCWNFNMPQSLALVLVHIIFSTKNRMAFLQSPDLRSEVHANLTATLRGLDCEPGRWSSRSCPHPCRAFQEDSTGGTAEPKRTRIYTFLLNACTNHKSKRRVLITRRQMAPTS